MLLGYVRKTEPYCLKENEKSKVSKGKVKNMDQVFTRIFPILESRDSAPPHPQEEKSLVFGIVFLTLNMVVCRTC
jgi:hypothetical protein